MSVFLRLLKILHTCGRYRLDTLLPNRLPWLWRLFFACYSNRINNRGEQLRLACEELGPIFVKFGQLLSTRPDLVPPDIVSELNDLQDNVPPFDSQVFRQKVTEGLGQPLDVVFQSFDDLPLASASVAQVHAAVLHNGQQVVVKTTRPGIEAIIEQDVQLLRLLARLIERILADGKRLKPVEVVEDYRTTIFDELDLQREAANAAQLRRNFLHSPKLYVPEIYWDFCAPQVIVMERIYGIPVTDVDTLRAQNIDLKKLAERGVEIFFTQVFEHNFFHADMHPGNIFVSQDRPESPQYIAVDMAIVGTLSREDQYYLARNMLAMFRRDYRQVAELHVQSGWVPKETKVNELEAAVRTVCEPVFDKPLADISFGKVLITLFATARRFNMEVQPQLVLLQKTLLNIEGLGRQLYPELDLWQTAHPYLERWMKNRFHPRTLYQQLKYHAPEWLEKFPDLPGKIYNNIEKVEELGEMVPVVHELAENFHRGKKKQSRKRFMVLLTWLLSLGFIGTIVPGLSTSLAEQSPYTLGLGAAALLGWLYLWLG